MVEEQKWHWYEYVGLGKKIRHADGGRSLSVHSFRCNVTCQPSRDHLNPFDSSCMRSLFSVLYIVSIISFNSVLYI